MNTLPISGQTLRIATQNIQWGGDPAPGGDGDPRISRLVPYLTRLDADVLVLTEFKSGYRGEELKELLQNAGYPHLIHREQGPKALGTAIASRLPVSEIELPVPPTFDSWRSVAVRIAGVDMIGFYSRLERQNLITGIGYWTTQRDF